MKTKINAADLKWGVEIETHIPAGITPIGGYHHGVQCPWLPQGWKAEHDGSIGGFRGERRACEFVSPILSGVEGVKQLHGAILEIERRGARVNATCGVHVTVGFTGDAEALGRLVNIVASFEAGLYAMTGTHSREQGHYCQSVKQYGSKGAAQRNAENSRYHCLNLANISSGRVEFRIFSGTTNPVKILAWVAMCLGMVERAINGPKLDKWNPNSKILTDWSAGKGMGNLRWLLQRMEWRADATVQWKWRGVFWRGVEGLPKPMQMKKELLRLGKKYDKENQRAAA